jgi:hypothetical protein
LNKSSKDPKIFQLSVVNTSSTTRRPLQNLIPVSGIEIHLPFTVQDHKLLSKDKVKINIDKNMLRIDNLEEFCSIKLEI